MQPLGLPLRGEGLGQLGRSPQVPGVLLHQVGGHAPAGQQAPPRAHRHRRRAARRQVQGGGPEEQDGEESKSEASQARSQGCLHQLGWSCLTGTGLPPAALRLRPGRSYCCPTSRARQPVGPLQGSCRKPRARHLGPEDHSQSQGGGGAQGPRGEEPGGNYGQIPELQGSHRQGPEAQGDHGRHHQPQAGPDLAGERRRAPGADGSRLQGQDPGERGLARQAHQGGAHLRLRKQSRCRSKGALRGLDADEEGQRGQRCSCGSRTRCSAHRAFHQPRGNHCQIKNPKSSTRWP